MQILRKSSLYGQIRQKLLLKMQIQSQLPNYIYFMAKSDKNHYSKCKYLGNITPYGPLDNPHKPFTKIHIHVDC